MARQRAVGIVIEGDRVLLMKRHNHGKHYWVFPGGGKEDSESLRVAVVRELAEETSLKVSVEKLLYEQFLDDDVSEHYFLCRFLGGTPKLGNSVESAEMKVDSEQSWDPEWVNIEELPSLLLYPLEVRDWLIEDLKNDFKNGEVRTMKISISDRRQTL